MDVEHDDVEPALDPIEFFESEEGEETASDEEEGIHAQVAIQKRLTPEVAKVLKVDCNAGIDGIFQ